MEKKHEIIDIILKLFELSYIRFDGNLLTTIVFDVSNHVKYKKD